MKININSEHIELTPAITAYLEKRLASMRKFLGAHYDTAVAQVELGKTTRHHKSGDFFKAEAHVRVWGKQFSAGAIEADLYAAIDAMKDELSHELNAHKERKTVLERKGGRHLKELLHHVRAIRRARKEEEGGAD